MIPLKRHKTEEEPEDFGEILVIDDYSQVIGNFNVYTDVRIDGYVEGNLKTTKSVVINSYGSFKGNITCSNITVYGRIDGNMEVERFALLKSSSVCNGILHTGNLEVDPGSILNIQIKMSRTGIKFREGEQEPVCPASGVDSKVIPLRSLETGKTGDETGREREMKKGEEKGEEKREAKREGNREQREGENSISDFLINKLKS